MTTNILTIFIPTIFVASITPSICMILSLNVGTRVGVLKSLWMIFGELLGVSIVFIICGLGASSVLGIYPKLFLVVKYAGGAYIIWLGGQAMLSQGKINLQQKEKKNTPWGLALQGFFAAILHPKAWVFFAVFIPSFLLPNRAILPQVIFLLLITLLIEFCNMLLYASGGQYLKKILQFPHKVCWVHRISGAILVMVGLWLALF